jgi:biotin-dependent carboxylase-like uncharacterized protein
VSAQLEFTQGGLGNTVQDPGRAGRRHLGLPASGWLDPWLARCANALVGNGLTAAVLEMRALGPTVLVNQGSVRLSLAGQVTAQVVRASGVSQPVAPWQAITLTPGDALKVGAITSGCAYLACSGGWQTPLAMGSQSTYALVGLGGHEGRALQTGDVLTCPGLANADSPSWQAPAFEHATGPIRLMWGPQDDHFTEDAKHTLTHTEWQASSAQDRMGLRLSGTALTHASAAAADIISDGIVPGAMQVPANGQPIVLLADCQTMGGYPKIATVISADLPRMAHLPAGRVCRFEAVTPAQAQAALIELNQRWQTWQRSLSAYVEPGWVDTQAMHQGNLISGMVHALQPE